MNNTISFSAHKGLMYNLIFYLVLLFPFLSLNAQTWQQQASGVGNSLISVFFLDEMKGWAVGNYGAIIHTTDGGENWSQQLLYSD